MGLTKKIGRTMQWAGEKMGKEAKTTTSDEFKALETEMSLRSNGMLELQCSMNAFIKWQNKHLESMEDKEKAMPRGFLGRVMVEHGEDFEEDSDFGNNLIIAGRAHQQLADLQERYAADAAAAWLDSVDRSVAMMKEYNAARKKLENRRLTMDASTSKLSKARRDDYRIEEEVRSSKAKYEESSEDILRRMQDIREAEADSVRDLHNFIDVDLEYHERCIEELRRAKESMAAAPTGRSVGGRSRSNTTRSQSGRIGMSRAMSDNRIQHFDDAESLTDLRITSSRPESRSKPTLPSRPAISRAQTYQGTSPHSRVPSISSNTLMTGQPAFKCTVASNHPALRPLNRTLSTPGKNANVFADDDDSASRNSMSGDERSEASSATSYGSGGGLSRTTSSTTGLKKAPPPPPSRAKKPAPPIPVRR